MPREDSPREIQPPLTPGERKLARLAAASYRQDQAARDTKPDRTGQDATGPCWSGYCIATLCNGVDHVDATGFTWTEHHPEPPSRGDR
jgi:hypothetical protein